MNASSWAEANSNRRLLSDFFMRVRMVDAENRAGQDLSDLGGAGFR